MAEKYLGIDIGGTNVKMGVVDTKENSITNFYSHDTSSWRKTGEFLSHLGDAIALQLLEHPYITKVGIGVPGLITRDRLKLVEITAIPEINGKPIIPYLSKKFRGVSFFLENDANAAALGEYYFGEGQIPENYIFVTLGTGVGGAAIIDKKVFKGGEGNAMEPGHLPAKDGKVLERHVGKVELLNLANKMAKNYTKKTVLPKDGSISTTGLVAAASNGDKLALMVFTEIGEVLAEGLVAMIRILDIKTILIGGGLSASFDYILPAIEKSLDYWLTPYYTENLIIKRATLANDAGLLGAASLCF